MSVCWNPTCGGDVPATSSMPNFCGRPCRDAYWGELHDGALSDDGPRTLPGAHYSHPITRSAVVKDAFEWLDVRRSGAGR